MEPVVVTPSASSGPTGREWTDPTIVGVNKLAPRSTARSFASVEEARAASIALTMASEEPTVDTARSRSLDGPWRFRWAPNLSQAPVGFHQPELDTSGWDSIEVPSVWELQGHGELIYVPAHLPGALKGGPPPSIDIDRAPIGCYQRTFELPVDWDGMRVTTLFHGVSSAMHLWVNGVHIGYSQVSRSPAELDISAAVRPGTNHIAVQVHRWCDGSYLENQDMWMFSGIFRSVGLRAEPRVRIDDLALRTIDDDGRLALEVTAQLAAGRAGDLPGDLAPGHTVEVTLTSDDGTTTSASVAAPTGEPGAVTCVVDAPTARRWTAETPHLSDVLVSLVGPDGAVLDVRRLRHGFRTVTIEGARLLVNGVPVLLTGVNRHDLDPVTGSTMTPDRLREDVRLLKAANINAVRTAHYPDDERFYDLCDEVGLYVLDEADLESHAVRKKVPGSDPRWTMACLDRVERLVGRDRNRACVIMWSLGNEAGFGSNHVAMAERVRALDPSRPIHYEGDHQAAVTDVWSAMYATPAQLRRGAEGRGYPLRRTNLAEQIWSGREVDPARMAEVPLMLCEYAHCMGNSLGNIDEYVDIFRSHDNCIGGFIWDFADQGLRHELPDGTTMWARGGDLGDERNFGSFCGNGIVAADRTPHPAYHQVAAVYADVEVRLAIGRSAFEVTNRFSFRTLDGAVARWRWTVDGEEASPWREAPLAAAPGLVERVPVSAPPDHAGGEELRLEVEVVDPAAVPWSASGQMLARVSLGAEDGLSVRPGIPAARRRAPVAADSRAALERERGGHVVRAGGVLVRLDATSGEVTSYQVDGRECLASPIAPNLWRAQTDNEIAAAVISPKTRGRDLNPWRAFTEGRTCTETAARTDPDGQVRLTSTWRIRGGLRPFVIDWVIDGAGNLAIDARFTPLLDLPRMGVTFELVAGYDTLTWFGRGPHETMWDRKSGAPVARHRSAVADLVHDYLRPQENGNRTDVRWAILSGGAEPAADGPTPFTISAATAEGLEMTARPYRQSDLADATHTHLIPRRATTTVTVDSHQRGAGGDLPAGVSTVGLHRQFRLRRLVPQRLACVISPGSGSAGR